MLSKRQHQYLQAMGITPWRLRPAIEQQEMIDIENDAPPSDTYGKSTNQHWCVAVDDKQVLQQYETVLLDIVTLLNPGLKKSEDKRSCIGTSLPGQVGDARQTVCFAGEKTPINSEQNQHYLPAIDSWIKQPAQKREIWMALQALLNSVQEAG